MIDFNKVLQTLRQGVTTIAEKSLKDYVAAATADGQAILTDMQADLENWTIELAAGAISKADFADLVRGQKDELELVALKQTGLAEIAADQFKLDICDLITTTVLALIP